MDINGNIVEDVVGRPHCSDPNLYIFVTYFDDGYKMTAVSLDNARASTEPSTPDDKFLQYSSNTISMDVDDKWCDVWDGDGFDTRRIGSTVYDLKNVKVSGCGLYI